MALGAGDLDAARVLVPLEGGVGGVNIGGFSFRPEMRPSDISLCSMLSSSSFSVDFIRSATASFPEEALT